MVKIICRIKPPKEDNIELLSDNKIFLYKKGKNLLDKSIIKPYQFELDKFYDHDRKTEEIYESEIKKNLASDFGLFIYGHTGSGKTFTLFGNDKSKGIFDLIASELNNSFEMEVLDLRYNGIYDLFTENKVVLYSNENKEDICQNTFKQKINNDNFNYFKEIIYNSRTRGKSKHNLTSSRSHLVIYIYKNNKKYTIVDLAGNERKPNLYNKISELETSYINSSLLALKECFRAIGKNYMPFRRSDLTRLLKPILSKNNLLICTIHSGFPYFYDSIDTLNYIYSLLNKVKSKPDFFERKVLPLSPKKIPKIKNKFLFKNKMMNDDNNENKERLSPKNLFMSKNDFIKSDDSLSDKFSDMTKEDSLDKLNLIEDLDDDFNFKIDYDFDHIADGKLDNETISNLINKKENLVNEFEEEEYVDDFENESSYQSLESSEARLIVKNSLNNKYKRKVVGLINHFIYKKIVSNYKDLLNKDIETSELDMLILTTTSILDFSIKELSKL